MKGNYVKLNIEKNTFSNENVSFENVFTVFKMK